MPPGKFKFDRLLRNANFFLQQYVMYLCRQIYFTFEFGKITCSVTPCAYFIPDFLYESTNKLLNYFHILLWSRGVADRPNQLVVAV